MSKGFRIARIAGIDVVLDWSLVFIFTLIAFSLSMGLFPAWHPEWSSALNWVTGLSAAVLFFVSVLAHEMSHALVGRAQGMEINRITLFIFGGMAHLRAEPRNWRAELRMAAVGPVTSLVLGAFFIALAGLLAGPVEMNPANPEAFLSQLGPVASLLTWLGPINIVLGLFNLVPGFPLDGGRILRAVLWGITGDLRTATRWASELGRGFAWLLILLGVGTVFGLRVPIFGSGPVSGLWLAFIGWFLHNAALTSYRQLLIKETLEEVPVKRLMRTRVITLKPDLTVEALVNDYMMGSDQRAFPVTENSCFMGLVCLQDVRKIARDSWPGTSVKDIMTAADQLSMLAPNDDAAEALFELARRNVNQLPVVSEDRFQGLLTREDILKWLMLHGEGGNET